MRGADTKNALIGRCFIDFLQQGERERAVEYLLVDDKHLADSTEDVPQIRCMHLNFVDSTSNVVPCIVYCASTIGVNGAPIHTLGITEETDAKRPNAHGSSR